MLLNQNKFRNVLTSMKVRLCPVKIDHSECAVSVYGIIYYYFLLPRLMALSKAF